MTNQKIETLDSVFKFSESDLLANRQGKLTGQQRVRLKAKAKSFLILSAVVCLVAGLAILWIVGTFDLVTGIFLFGLVLLLGSVLIGPRYLDWKEDINSDRVAKICDCVFLDIQYRRGRFGNINFRLTIGLHTFDISKDALLSFENGQNYCLYYAPKTKAILSVEKMPSSACSTPSQSQLADSPLRLLEEN